MKRGNCPTQDLSQHPFSGGRYIISSTQPKLQCTLQNFPIQTCASIKFDFPPTIPLRHLPRSDVPPAPRRAAPAQQVQMAPNPLAALLAWRVGNKTGRFTSTLLAKNKVPSLKLTFSHVEHGSFGIWSFRLKGLLAYFQGVSFREGIFSVNPPGPTDSHKWMFGLGFATKNGIILVVTFTGWRDFIYIDPIQIKRSCR